jgi:hypothetical protein
MMEGKSTDLATVLAFTDTPEPYEGVTELQDVHGPARIVHARRWTKQDKVRGSLSYVEAEGTSEPEPGL